MMFRKTLAASVAHAADALAATADEQSDLAAVRLADVMEPLRRDMDEAAFLLTVALVTLGACILAAAVLVSLD